MHAGMNEPRRHAGAGILPTAPRATAVRCPHARRTSRYRQHTRAIAREIRFAPHEQRCTIVRKPSLLYPFPPPGVPIQQFGTSSA